VKTFTIIILLTLTSYLQADPSYSDAARRIRAREIKYSNMYEIIQGRKEMISPEKIYLQYTGTNDDTWCSDRVDDSDIEYVRADKYVELENTVIVYTLEDKRTKEIYHKNLSFEQIELGNIAELLSLKYYNIVSRKTK
jgi:hypothetical protein